jgi:formamidase
VHGLFREGLSTEGIVSIPFNPCLNLANCIKGDIKNLSRGSKVYLPVHVKGAKFSVGDLHFSQGDGKCLILNLNRPKSFQTTCLETIH